MEPTKAMAREWRWRVSGGAGGALPRSDEMRGLPYSEASSEAWADEVNGGGGGCEVNTGEGRVWARGGEGCRLEGVGALMSEC